jgi:predicted MFS family arabinose efflux permease
MGELLSYIRERPMMGLTLKLLALLSIVGVPYMVLMPIFADKILHGGARGFGLLTAASGLGAVAGALMLARRRGTTDMETVLFRSTVAFGAGMVLFALSNRFWLSMLLLPIAGYGLMVGFAASNTLIQSMASDEMRGRMMSLFAVVFMGMSPIGSLLGGAVADRVGAPATLLFCGFGCLAGAFWFRKAVRGLGESEAAGNLDALAA